MKISDAYEYPAPIDPYKTLHVPQVTNKHKFTVPDKVNNINHWKHSDKFKDLEMEKGRQPNLKWSDKEMSYKCQGNERPCRTFEKIIKLARIRDKEDEIKEQQLEELLIK